MRHPRPGLSRRGRRTLIHGCQSTHPTAALWRHLRRWLLWLLLSILTERGQRPAKCGIGLLLDEQVVFITSRAGICPHQVGHQ